MLYGSIYPKPGVLFEHALEELMAEYGISRIDVSRHHSSPSQEVFEELPDDDPRLRGEKANMLGVLQKAVDGMPSTALPAEAEGDDE